MLGIPRRSGFSPERRLEIEGTPVEIVRKKIKHLHLTVYPAGRVRVSAPQRLGDEAVRSFVSSRIGWIRRKQAIFAAEEREAPLRSVTGETHDRWYREVLDAEIERLLARWEPVIKVRISEWSLRRMTTRWGTCNVGRRRICLNTELAKRSPASLEYVVVHEMVHLLDRRHGDAFKAHMDRFMPDWRLRRAELRSRVPLATMP